MICITDKCLGDFFSEHWTVEQVSSPCLVILLLGIRVSKRTVLCMRTGAVAIIQRASMVKLPKEYGLHSSSGLVDLGKYPYNCPPLKPLQHLIDIQIISI